MAVTASGLFIPTFVNVLTSALTGFDLSSETGVKCALIDQGTATPDFDTHDYWADLSAAEVTGTNWAAGGVVLTTTTLTASPTGTLKFDAADVSEATTTIGDGGTGDAYAAVIYSDSTTAPTADALVCLVNFGAGYQTVAGTFAITWDSAGIFTIDMTP